MKFNSKLPIIVMLAVCAVTSTASSNTPTASARPPISAPGKFGTPNIEVTVDPRWTTYGAYLQRMLDLVQAQWDQNAAKIGSRPQSGKVRITFDVNSSGEVHILKTESTVSDQATAAAVSGITDPAPFGPWTEVMKAKLGVEQRVLFTFSYR